MVVNYKLTPKAMVVNYKLTPKASQMTLLSLASTKKPGNISGANHNFVKTRANHGKKVV